MSLITKEVELKRGLRSIYDLSPYSYKPLKIIYKCDNCNDEKEMTFRHYYEKHNGNLYEQDICTECKLLLIKQKKIQDKYDNLVEMLKNNDFILITSIDNFIGAEYFDVICEKHKEKGVQTICRKTITRGNNGNKIGCKHCRTEKYIESLTGENNHNWNNGITEIRKYLRNSLENSWRLDSFKASNFRCILTGDRNRLQVHHTTGFSTILMQTFEETEMPIYQNIGEYTEEELQLIRDKCLQLHYEYGLGVCIREDVHTLFHSIYGYGDNTPEQWYEFVDRYKAGEFSG